MTNNLLDSMILTLSWPFSWFIIDFFNLLGHIYPFTSFFTSFFVLLCIIMYYYVFLCIIMYSYVFLCTIMYHYVLLCTIMYYYVLLCTPSPRITRILVPGKDRVMGKPC